MASSNGKHAGPSLATVLLSLTCAFGGFAGGLSYVVDAATAKPKPFVARPPAGVVRSVRMRPGTLPLRLPVPGARPLPGSAVNLPLPSGSSITANGQTLQWTAFEAGSVSIQLTGTWTGTVQFEASNDGATWAALKVINDSTDAVVTSATANGTFVAPGGYLAYRLRASAAVTGTLVPAVFTNDGSNVIRVVSGGTATVAGTVTANQGTQGAGGAAAWQVQGAGANAAALVGNPVRIGVSDGTNAQDVREFNQLNSASASGVMAVGAMLYDSTASTARALRSTRNFSDGDNGAQALMIAPWVLNPANTYDRYRPTIGVQANAWNAAATGANGTSTAVDCGQCSQVAIFGNVSGATTLTVQYSQDNTNFYDSGTTTAPTANFGITTSVGARYVRIKSSASVTATVTIAAKA